MQYPFIIVLTNYTHLPTVELTAEDVNFQHKSETKTNGPTSEDTNNNHRSWKQQLSEHGNTQLPIAFTNTITNDNNTIATKVEHYNNASVQVHSNNQLHYVLH